MSQPAAAPYSVTYKRDMLNRIVGVGRPGDDFAFGRYGYNGHGNVVDEELNASSPTARITRRLRYDALGNLVGIEDPFATYAYSFRANGADTGPYLDGSLTAESVRFNAAGFAPGQAPQNFRYDYAHDPFARLRSATASDPDTHAPLAAWNMSVDAYDADNSILALTRAGQRYDYERADGTHRVRRIVSNPGGVTRSAYNYDVDGSVRRVAGTATIGYDYDPFSGLPRRAAVQDGPTLGYAMSTEGRRVVKSVRTAQSTRTELSLGIARAPYVELTRTSGPETSRRYIWGPLGLLGIDTGSDTLLLARDRLGSVRVAASAQNGKAAAWFNYLPYGDNMPGNCGGDSAQVDAVKYRFTGQEWEPELGLYNYGARWYESGTAIFHTVDSMHETPNPYAYVRNDPLNRIDPTGLTSSGLNLIASGREAVQVEEDVISASQAIAPRRSQLARDIDLHRSDPALKQAAMQYGPLASQDTEFIEVMEDYAIRNAEANPAWVPEWKNYTDEQLRDLSKRFPESMKWTDHGMLGVTRAVKWAFRAVYAGAMSAWYIRENHIEGAGRIIGAALLLIGANIVSQIAGDRIYQQVRRQVGKNPVLGIFGPPIPPATPTNTMEVAMARWHVAMRTGFPIVHFFPIFGEAFVRAGVIYGFSVSKDKKFSIWKPAVQGALNLGLQWAVSGGRSVVKITHDWTNKGLRNAVTARHPSLSPTQVLATNAWTSRRVGMTNKIGLRAVAEISGAVGKVGIDALYLSVLLPLK